METSISQKALKTLNMNFLHNQDRTETVGDLINATLITINKGYIPGLIASLNQRPGDWFRLITMEKDITRYAKEEDKGALVKVLEEYEDFFDKMTRSFLHSINAVAIPQKDQIQVRSKKEVRKEMRVKDMFPSKYLGKEDILEPRILTIRECSMEDIEFEENLETKPVLYFREYGERGLILNKTNAVSLEDLYGDTDNWLGKMVEVFIDLNIRFGKQKIGGVRMRAPAQPSLQQEM